MEKKSLKQTYQDASISLTLIPEEVISTAHSKKQQQATATEKQSKSNPKVSTKTKPTRST